MYDEKRGCGSGHAGFCHCEEKTKACYQQHENHVLCHHTKDFFNDEVEFLFNEDHEVGDGHDTKNC